MTAGGCRAHLRINGPEIHLRPCGVSQTGVHAWYSIRVHPVLGNHIVTGAICTFFFSWYGWFSATLNSWSIAFGLLFPGASNVLVTKVSAVS